MENSDTFNYIKNILVYAESAKILMLLKIVIWQWNNQFRIGFDPINTSHYGQETGKNICKFLSDKNRLIS